MSAIDTTLDDIVLADEIVKESRSRTGLTDFAGPVIVFAVFIGLWYLLSTVILAPEKRFLLPTPDF